MFSNGGGPAASASDPSGALTWPSVYADGPPSQAELLGPRQARVCDFVDRVNARARGELDERAVPRPSHSGRFNHHSVAQSWPKRRQDAWLYHAVLLQGDLKHTEQIKLFFSLRR